MTLRVRIACWLLLGCGVALPAVLSAQSRQSVPSSVASDLTEEQRRGKVLFFQNCAFCHWPQKEPKRNTEGKTIGPVLSGLFRRAAPAREEAVREFIRQGTKKMPGFQYGLNRQEIDDIIAYIKTL